MNSIDCLSFASDESDEARIPWREWATDVRNPTRLLSVIEPEDGIPRLPDER